MDKLKYNKYIVNILNQYHKLFFCKKRSNNSHKHWNKIIKFKSSNYSKNIFHSAFLKNFFKKTLFIPEKNTINNSKLNTPLLSVSSYKLVFFNGFFCKSLSDNDYGEWKIKIQKKNKIHTSPKFLIKSNFFLHLSESLSEDIICIDLEKNSKVSKPLYLIQISEGKENNKIAIINSRIHVNIKENARGEIIEHFLGNNNYSYCNNVRTTFLLDDHAQINYIKINLDNFNSYHFSNNDILLNKNSKFFNHIFTFGGCIYQNHSNIALKDSNINLLINSLSIPSSKQIIDINTYVDHQSCLCKSRQLHKMILSECSKGKFFGIIKVEKNAIKTDGHMKNDNLLTSKYTQINTKPQLEIYADDVKCSHGATIGYINSKHLFYLRSRGISKTNAKKMIIHAFALEVLKHISNKSVYDILNNLIISFLEKIKI
ncbi:MAG: Fe-S cluster assembly protein SufD [Wigglesworthia glossinidia]|nr:Fe-S cluster assembly protein SufD [Wigglesworthia glossinidia]